MKYSTIIDTGTYSDKILVTVGTTWEELNTFTKDFYGNKRNITLDKDLFNGTCDGFFDDNTNVLWLSQWRGNVYDQDVLRHECHHVAQILLGVKRGMHEELEALAYQQDYLIKKIRDILNTERRKQCGIKTATNTN